MPAEWYNQDVGSISPAGSATYDSGTFTLNGAGADIWDTSDGNTDHKHEQQYICRSRRKFMENSEVKISNVSPSTIYVEEWLTAILLD